jgi:malate dehydrogenase (oxaloacetate-decarboxylating)
MVGLKGVYYVESGTNAARCVDKPGLLLKGKKDQLTPAQVPYAREDKEWDGKEHGDLLSVVKEVKPHVLIGTSTKPGAFSEDVVREMAKHVERPVIFPLSNPTRLHEAKPQDLYDWTDGKALVATGSPFAPVKHNGKEYDICERSLHSFRSPTNNLQPNATTP